MKTIEESAQTYFNDNFQRFSGMGIAVYKSDATIPSEVDQSEWENFWLALDVIENEALQKDIHNVGRPEEERI